MRRHLWLACALLATATLLACTKGEECDICKGGFVCSQFSDGTKRCGSGLGATTCRVR